MPRPAASNKGKKRIEDSPIRIIGNLADQYRLPTTDRWMRLSALPWCPIDAGHPEKSIEDIEQMARMLVHGQPTSCSARQVVQALLRLARQDHSPAVRAKARLLLFSLVQHGLADAKTRSATKTLLARMLSGPKRAHRAKKRQTFALDLAARLPWLGITDGHVLDAWYEVIHYGVSCSLRWDRWEAHFDPDVITAKDTVILSVVFGLRYYSVSKNRFRLSHGLSLGATMFFDLQKPDNSDEDANDDDFFPLPILWASPADLWFRLWDRLWLHLAPVALLYFVPMSPILESRISFRWEF